MDKRANAAAPTGCSAMYIRGKSGLLDHTLHTQAKHSQAAANEQRNVIPVSSGVRICGDVDMGGAVMGDKGIYAGSYWVDKRLRSVSATIVATAKH